MSDTLAQLITKTQAALGDASGTYFTSAIVTAAVRAALSEINERAPIHAGDLVTVVADQKEYEVTDFDPAAAAVLDVLERDDDGEDDIGLKYDTYQEDARLWIRLRTALDDGTLIVRYTKWHTVSGLDSEVESTLPAMHDQYLVSGTAYHALMILSVLRVAGFSLDKAATDNYREAAAEFRKRFDAALTKLSAQSPPVSEPDTSAWDDEWHNWQ